MHKYTMRSLTITVPAEPTTPKNVRNHPEKQEIQYTCKQKASQLLPETPMETTRVSSVVKMKVKVKVGVMGKNSVSRPSLEPL